MSRRPLLALSILSCLVLAACPLRAEGQPAAPARQAKILILTGNEYPGHPWK